MTRDEITVLYEEALLDFLENTPCTNCGGDNFLRAQNVSMSAFFFVELSERWKDKQVAKMSVDKAAKTSRKKMERHFNELVEKELEKAFTSGKETGEGLSASHQPSPQTPQPPPSPSPTPQTETPYRGPDPEEQEPQKQQPQQPAEEDQSSDPERRDQAHVAESSGLSDAPEESSPLQESEGPKSQTHPDTSQ